MPGISIPFIYLCSANRKMGKIFLHIMKAFTLISFYLLSYVSLHGQSNKIIYPQIGKQCPDFNLKNIQNFNRSQSSLKQFRNKWLILDFWTFGCVVCFESFPKIDEFQKDFAEKVQFILVGLNNKRARLVFDKFRKHYNLQLAVAYDNILFNQFSIESVPHIVVIDPHGIVRAITYSLSKNNFEDLLKGKDPMLPNKLNEKEIES